MELTASSDGTSNVLAWAQAVDAQTMAMTALPQHRIALRANILVSALFDGRIIHGAFFFLWLYDFFARPLSVLDTQLS
jgi:hypothetical protein